MADEGQIKTSIGWLEVKNYSADPTDTDSTRGGFAIVSDAPKYWTGSAWTAFTGTGSGVTSWNSLYDTGVTMDVDSLGLAWTISTNVAGLTLNKTGSGAGGVLVIANAGTGDDITGPDWSFNGDGTLTTVELGTGATINATDGDLELSVSLSTVTVQGDILVDETSIFTGAVTATASVAITGTADTTVLDITNGDIEVDNGTMKMTNDDDGPILTLTANSATNTDAVSINATGTTSGTVLQLVTASATLSGGYYFECYDGAAHDFSIGVDGATTITSAVNSTKALHVTGIQTSENMVTFDNTGGVVADGYGVVLIDAGGAVADGGAALRVVLSGTPAAGAVGIELAGKANAQGIKIDCAGLDTQEALWIDSDAVGNSVVLIHTDGAQTADKGALVVESTGNLATGGNVVRIDVTGAPTANAIPVELDFAGMTATHKPTCVVIDVNGVDAQALSIDADPSTKDVVSINSDSVIASGMATLKVTAEGAIASGGSILRVDALDSDAASGAILVLFDFAGIGNTNENIGFKIDAGGEKVQALYIDADPIDGSVAYIHSDAVIKADNGLLYLHSEGDIATGGNVLRITTGGTPVTGAIACEMDVQDDCMAMLVTTSSATNHAVHIKGGGNIGADKALLCVETTATAMVADSSLVRIMDSGSAAGAGTMYGLIINMDGTNLQGLWVEKGTATFAEIVTITTGGLTVSAGGATIAGDSTIDGALVINDSGADKNLRIEASGEANAFCLDGGNANVSINGAMVSAHYDLMLRGDGVLGLTETSTPTADANYGKVYCKNTNKLFFQDGAGTEHELAFA